MRHLEVLREVDARLEHLVGAVRTLHGGRLRRVHVLAVLVQAESRLELFTAHLTFVDLVACNVKRNTNMNYFVL